MARINWLDRIPTIAGRWLKSNETDTHVTLTRADEPTEAGTALNASNMNQLIQFEDLNTADFKISGTTVSTKTKPINTYQNFMTGRLGG